MPVTRERVLVISDITLDRAGRVRPATSIERTLGREGELVLVNGQVVPRLTAGPGERERWRVVNACAARYLRLRLDGQQLQLLGIDSGRLPTEREIEEIVLAPGNRADIVVTTREGNSQLRAIPYDRGGMMGMTGAGGAGDASGTMHGIGQGDRQGNPDTAGTVLATVDVAGVAAAELAAMPTRPAPPDLRGRAVSVRRTLTFAMGMGGAMNMGDAGTGFTIDGKRFDAARIDQAVRAGTVEEWTLTNTSPMDHPLHLHVRPMQIVEYGGQPVRVPTWQDVVNVPARGNTKVLIAFDTFAGRTVYHCHILDHEDNGMMGVVDVR